MKKIIIVFSIGVLSTNVQAQAKKEVGVLLTSFNNGFDLVFKKQKSENKYWRGNIGLGINISSATESRDLYIGAEIGVEKRKFINEKLAFARGFNYGINNSIIQNSIGDNIGTLGLKLGYIIGMQYHLNKNFYLMGEIEPQINVGYIYQSNNANTGINLNTNSFTKAARLGIAYKF